MGNQTSKVIDITKTFIPVDPEAFPSNMGFTGKEDSPTEEEAVSAFEGYNFMPTSYGYRSYFGINSLLQADSLTSRVDDIFVVQSAEFANYIIALCEDGIWMKQGEAVTAWVQVVTIPVPDPGYTKRWTKTAIGNTLYCYQAGMPYYYRMEYKEVIGTPPLLAPAVTGLAVVKTEGASNALDLHYYSVAYFNSEGLLSSPTEEVGVTFITAQATGTMSWNKLA